MIPVRSERLADYAMPTIHIGTMDYVNNSDLTN
jgi:hypothetical protein